MGVSHGFRGGGGDKSLRIKGVASVVGAMALSSRRSCRNDSGSEMEHANNETAARKAGILEIACYEISDYLSRIGINAVLCGDRRSKSAAQQWESSHEIKCSCGSVLRYSTFRCLERSSGPMTGPLEEIATRIVMF